MPTYRQGNGEIKTMKATGPDTRLDGTALERAEVAHFEFDLTFEGGLSIAAMQGSLSDDPATPEWDGEFSELIDIDGQEPGIYTLNYRTVDTDGRISPNSDDFIMEILPPLVAPNPPTNVSQHGYAGFGENTPPW